MCFDKLYTCDRWDVTLVTFVHGQRTTECEDKARILETEFANSFDTLTCSLVRIIAPFHREPFVFRKDSMAGIPTDNDDDDHYHES